MEDPLVLMVKVDSLSKAVAPIVFGSTRTALSTPNVSAFPSQRNVMLSRRGTAFEKVDSRSLARECF